jgi:hypothetical protein
MRKTITKEKKSTGIKVTTVSSKETGEVKIKGMILHKTGGGWIQTEMISETDRGIDRVCLVPHPLTRCSNNHKWAGWGPLSRDQVDRCIPLWCLRAGIAVNSHHLIIEGHLHPKVNMAECPHRVLTTNNHHHLAHHLPLAHRVQNHPWMKKRIAGANSVRSNLMR